MAVPKRSRAKAPKKEPEIPPEPEVLPPLPSGVPRVFSLRGHTVILDEDLAPRLGVVTRDLNRAVKRNIERIPADWLFQLTPAEYAKLSTPFKHGGRRNMPWAFTEHGVVMAASVVKSGIAIQAMQMVVETFIAARKGQSVTLPSPAHGGALLAPPPDAMSAKLKNVLDKMLDTVVDHQAQTTVRQEAQAILGEALTSFRERLKKNELENDELAARALQHIAQAEEHKAVAAKNRAETEEIEFALTMRKLRLFIEAERMMETGDNSGFIAVLDRLGDR